MMCGPCTARIPQMVGWPITRVFHPDDRPCTTVMVKYPEPKDPRCICTHPTIPFAGCVVHGEYGGET